MNRDGFGLNSVRDLAQFSDRVVVVLIVVSGAAALLYTFFFAFRDWRRDPPNRALMLKSLGNVLLLDALAVPFMIWGDYEWRWLVRLVAMTVFTSGLLYLLTALLLSPGARKYPPWAWFRRRR